jgi:hypothetical protein
MVEQVSEFVKNCFNFSMRQQRGLITDGRRQVAANQTQMWLETLGFRQTGKERIHPSSAALVFSRKPISVKTTEDRAVFIDDSVVLDRGIPYRRARFFYDLDPI